MSAPANLSTLPEVPADVLSFAAEMGVADWVYPILDMTARAYPGRPIKLYVQRDHEEPDWQSIVLETHRGDMTSPAFHAAHRQLSGEIVKRVPARVRQHFVNICL
jgi:hypothetical protein